MITLNAISSLESSRIKAMVLALGLHLVVLLPALIAPHLFFLPPKAPQKIHTVSLFSMAELASPALASPAPAPQSAPEIQQPAPPKAAEAIPELPPGSMPTPTPAPAPAPSAAAPAQPTTIAPETPVKATVERPTPVAAPAAPARPTTVAPETPVKVAGEQPPAPVPIQPSRSPNDTKQLAQLRQSIKLQAQAQEAARLAQDTRRQAVAAIQDAIILAQTPLPRSGSATATTTMTTSTVGLTTSGRRGDDLIDAITREYLVSLQRHLQNYWTLPDLVTWDRNLLATIVITVRRDGSLRGSAFEVRTENPFFNQLVQATIQNAAPMPPFPEVMNQSEMEIGLRFRPGEVF